MKLGMYDYARLLNDSPSWEEALKMLKEQYEDYTNTCYLCSKDGKFFVSGLYCNNRNEFHVDDVSSKRVWVVEELDSMLEIIEE